MRVKAPKFLNLPHGPLLTSERLCHVEFQGTPDVHRHTFRAPHFLMHSSCTDLFLLVVRVYSHTLSAFRPKTFTPHPHRAMSYTLQSLTPRTGTPSSPLLESVFQQSEKHCGDQRPQLSGALTEIPPVAGYEPNRIAEDRDYRHFTEDGQFTELEDLPVRPLSHHQSIIATTYDSAESIATPPDSDLDDEQLRALVASPLYQQEREASAERSQVYHCEGESVQFISRSDKYRETCRSVFKPE